MARQKLNYRFHNPNTVEATADYIAQVFLMHSTTVLLKIFMEVNEKKVERVIKGAAEKNLEENAIEMYTIGEKNKNKRIIGGY